MGQNHSTELVKSEKAELEKQRLAAIQKGLEVEKYRIAKEHEIELERLTLQREREERDHKFKMGILLLVSFMVVVAAVVTVYAKSLDSVFAYLSWRSWETGSTETDGWTGFVLGTLIFAIIFLGSYVFCVSKRKIGYTRTSKTEDMNYNGNTFSMFNSSTSVVPKYKYLK